MTTVPFDPAVGELLLRYARMVVARGYIHNSLGNIAIRVPHPGFEAGVAVDFCTELQGLARGVGAVGAGVEHGAAVAQTGHAIAVEQMGIDAGHLRRGVSPYPQGATTELVNQLEGLQVQGFAGAGEQRFEVLQQRRHDEFIAVAAGGIQEKTAQLFDVARLGGQDIGNLIGQLP